jgi:protein-serine/threonine kinase
MLLSPPSPPTRHPFSPQSSSSQSPPPPRSSLGAIKVPSDSYSSLKDFSYSPTSESSIPLSDPSPNSKTSAFFGSPFRSPSQSPDSAQSVNYLSKTAAFFSSPFTHSPTLPPNHQYTSHEVPSSANSLTADFFSPAAFSSCPTSPPSLHSSTSNTSLRTSSSHLSHHYTTPSPQKTEDVDSTPVLKSQVPLLARLFPSRYSSNARRTDDHRPRGERGFVDLDPPDDVIVTSPPPMEASDATEAPTVVQAVSSSSVNLYTTGARVHPDNEEEPSYELLHRIGQGAFSLVWLARVAIGESEGTLVAVKMIVRTGEHDAAAVRRAARGERASFMREVDVLHVRVTSRPHSLPTHL